MSVGAEQILAHHDTAFARDCAAVILDQEVLFDATQDLAATRTALADMLKPETHPRKRVSEISPFWSQTLLRFLYIDIRHDPDQAHAPSSELVSRTLLAHSGIELTTTATQHEYGTATPNMCFKAEGFFSQTADQMARSHAANGQAEGRNGQALIQTYHDSQGKPILLQKWNEDNTALVLEPLALGTTKIAPGTLVDIEGTDRRDQTGEKRFASFTLASFEATDQLQITPARLTPWAYAAPLDRAVFAVLHPHESLVNNARAEMLMAKTLSDFQLAGRQLMDICGVPAVSSANAND